jgi:hypothetical protein
MMKRSSTSELNSFIANEAEMNAQYSNTPEDLIEKMEEYKIALPNQDHTDKTKNSVIHMINKKRIKGSYKKY